MARREFYDCAAGVHYSRDQPFQQPGDLSHSPPRPIADSGARCESPEGAEPTPKHPLGDAAHAMQQPLGRPSNCAFFVAPPMVPMRGAGQPRALQAVLAAALLAATAQGACAPCATAPRPQPFRGAVHTLQRTASTPLALSLSPPADNWRDSVAASC
jgi:hypothetical protein